MKFWDKFNKFINEPSNDRKNENGLKIEVDNKKNGKFKIYDNTGSLKYIAKGKCISRKPHFSIYTMQGKEIGTIKQNKSRRYKYNTRELTIKIAGDKEVIFGREKNFFKSGYILDNGWKVKLNKSEYEIKDREEIIGIVSEKIVYSQSLFSIKADSHSYLATSNKYENELLVLMIALSLVIYIINEKEQEKEESRFRLLPADGGGE
ncbi:MAG: hypothetical protein HFJ53_06775 [Clostridia bacterium]|nr:hypothetical protein [Clostridia bacterium]